MLLLALAMASALARREAPATADCPGDTTPEINQCFAERAEQADRELARYVDAARRRLRRELADSRPTDPRVLKVPGEFDKAEQAWAAYRDAECDAVYDYWSEGTIRDVESLACRIRLTQAHTHSVWRQWLTYMDSTPPILPEPVVPADSQ